MAFQVYWGDGYSSLEVYPFAGTAIAILQLWYSIHFKSPSKPVIWEYNSKKGRGLMMWISLGPWYFECWGYPYMAIKAWIVISLNKREKDQFHRSSFNPIDHESRLYENFHHGIHTEHRGQMEQVALLGGIWSEQGHHPCAILMIGSLQITGVYKQPFQPRMRSLFINRSTSHTGML